MSMLLLATAAALGLLAFFEPCTIATHTLFAARTHHGSGARCCVALGQLVLSRTVLLAVLFGVAAWLGLESIAAATATAMLGVVGTIYLVSRKVYLPVPHLEFFRLLPRHHRLPQATKLGLTLPACTLPLVAVVGVLSAQTGHSGIAMLAGLAFAAMFSLPTIWDSMRGLNAAHRAFLGKAANASPYVTALLLWGGAFLIWQTGT